MERLNKVKKGSAPKNVSVSSLIILFAYTGARSHVILRGELLRSVEWRIAAKAAAKEKGFLGELLMFRSIV